MHAPESARQVSDNGQHQAIDLSERYPTRDKWPKVGGVGIRAWQNTSRWGKAWRVTVSVFAVWVLWLIVSMLVMFGPAPLFGGDQASLLSTAVLLSAGVPPLCGALAAALGDRPHRYSPFGKAMTFGAVVFGGGAVVMLAIAIASGVFAWPCGAGEDCAGGAGAFVLLGLFLLTPLLFAAAAGYRVALWAASPRGLVVLWRLAGGTLALVGLLGGVSWLRHIGAG